MSLVTDVFDYVKTNPGVDGMKIQNHCEDNTVSETISDLEEQHAIRWTRQGYYAIKQQITEMKLSLDDYIEELEKIIKDKISTTCPKCHVFADGRKQVEKIFGFRKSNGKIIPQSHCKKCRNYKQKKCYNHKGRHDPLECTTDFISARVAKNRQKNINIEGTVSQKETCIEFLPFSGRHRRTCTAYLLDNDGYVIKIRLWGKDVSRVQNGSRIRLLRAYTTKYDAETTVSIGFKGLLEVISFGDWKKPKKSHSFKPQIIPDQFSFENCIVDSTDDVLKIDIRGNFEQKRDDLKF